MKRKDAESQSSYLGDNPPEQFTWRRLSPFDSRNSTPNHEGQFNLDFPIDLPESIPPLYLHAPTPQGLSFPRTTMQVNGSGTPEIVTINNPFQFASSPMLATMQMPVFDPLPDNPSAALALPVAPRPPANSAKGLEEQQTKLSTTWGSLPAKSRRGRKKKRTTAEAIQAEAKRRMERNRVFARENRRRKKQYIETLENEVTMLKAELDACKKKLAHYEEYDKQRNKNFMDFYHRTRQEMQQLQKDLLGRLSEYSQKGSLAGLLPYVSATLEDRRNAIDIMAETMIRASLPLTHRFLMYIAESEAEPKSLQMARLRCPVEEWTTMMEQLKSDCNELLGTPGNRNFLRGSAHELRDTIKKVALYQSKFHEQIAKIDVFMIDKLLPQVSTHTFSNFIKWFHMVMGEGDLVGPRWCRDSLTRFKLTVERWPFASENQLAITGTEEEESEENAQDKGGSGEVADQKSLVPIKHLQ